MIGADILDKTNTNAFQFGRLREEPTWWELEPAQRIHFDEVQRLNQYLREEYHQLQVGLTLHDCQCDWKCTGRVVELGLLQAVRRPAGPPAGAGLGT